QFAYPQSEAVIHRNVRKCGPGGTREIDTRAGPRGQLAVSGNEVRVQMGLEDVANRQPLFLRCFKIDFHVALRIDNDALTLRSQQIRGMRQTAEIELFEVHKDGL